MDSRWFEEDRKLPPEDRAEAQSKSEEALKGSTLLIRRLTKILEDEIRKCDTIEEDFTSPNWQHGVLSMFARRKTLKEIIKLLP